MNRYNRWTLECPSCGRANSITKRVPERCSCGATWIVEGEDTLLLESAPSDVEDGWLFAWKPGVRLKGPWRKKGDSERFYSYAERVGRLRSRRMCCPECLVEVDRSESQECPECGAKCLVIRFNDRLPRRGHRNRWKQFVKHLRKHSVNRGR